jgi:FKBP-type peptidyl-prolyl cis-trans isomerase
LFSCGVNLIVKGLDETVLNMHVGDRLHVAFGGDLSFPNGKPQSPGRPRIPPNALVDYEVII